MATGMNTRLKNWLLTIHLYGGLIFFPYLVIFGLSGLHLNHDFAVFQEQQIWETQETQHFTFTHTEDKQILADSIKHALGLIGWAPWWDQYEKDGIFYNSVIHFGAEYRMELTLATGKLQWRRRSKGWGHVLHSLHFLGEGIPQASLLINSWQYYQHASVLYVIFAVLSGLWLFLRRKTERVLGLWVAGIAFSASLFYMLYLYLIG